MLLKPTHVLYAADEDGYTIRVMSDTVTLSEYNGGNSPYDSKVWMDPADPEAEPVDILWHFAKQTALEIGQENGIPPQYVCISEDLLPIGGA